MAMAIPGRRRRLDRGYPFFLIPGAVLFTAVIAVPFAMNIGISLTRWQGVGPMTWVGLKNYQRLFHDSVFWSSFLHNVGLVVAMAVVPTALGLVVAAGLFDFIGKRFGPRTASVLRACIYLPQVMPLAVMGVVWGWILAPGDGVLNSALKDVGLGSLAHDWLGDPNTALYTVMAIMVWIQLGFPVVIFMADQWKPHTLWDSRYLWMPLEIGDGKMHLPEPRPWTINVKKGTVAYQ